MNNWKLNNLIEIRKNIIKKWNHCLYDSELAYILTNCKDCKNKSMEREKCLDYKAIELMDILNSK
jgi:hypothetical protein